MKEKFAFTKGRLIGFICSALLPAIAIILGILDLTKGVVFNLAFAVTYILIPLIAAGLLALCIFSRWKPVPKAILSGVIIVLFVFSFVFFCAILGFAQAKHYEGAQAKLQYADGKGGNSLMPELSEIGQPIDIEYHNVLISMFICSAETDYLICRYAPEEYALQKAALEEKYVFQAEAIKEFPLYSAPSVCEPSAEVDGYQFRLLSVDEYKETIYYPKNLVLIGHSDAAQEIVYVAFYDIELDYIYSLKDFIVDDCGWKYVR